jgi:hypothetical protein
VRRKVEVSFLIRLDARGQPPRFCETVYAVLLCGSGVSADYRYFGFNKE